MLHSDGRRQQRTCSVAGADPVHRATPKIVQLLLLCSELCNAAIIAWPVWQDHILQDDGVGVETLWWHSDGLHPHGLPARAATSKAGESGTVPGSTPETV